MGFFRVEKWRKNTVFSVFSCFFVFFIFIYFGGKWKNVFFWCFLCYKMRCFCCKLLILGGNFWFGKLQNHFFGRFWAVGCINDGFINVWVFYESVLGENFRKTRKNTFFRVFSCFLVFLFVYIKVVFYKNVFSKHVFFAFFRVF